MIPTVHLLYHDRQFTPPPLDADHPPDRLASTPGDNLAEYAGRLCYSSLHQTKARPTSEYHPNIHETKHYSVYAHAVETFEVRINGAPGASTMKYWEGWTSLLLALHDRPGVWVTAADTWTGYLRFAVSLRAILEWREHGAIELGLVRGQDAASYLHTQLLALLTPHYPFTLAGAPAPAEHADVPWMEGLQCKLVAPQYSQEKWASLYLAGVSRDLLQELVRHHWQTNPSVRSTRYCDESDSTQIMHPAAVDHSATLTNAILNTYDQAKETYRMIFDHLTAAGVDKKQARGAARNVLPGATETKLVYSLSEFQAKHILGLRLAQSTGSADAEIHRLAAKMKDVLSQVFDLG